jgi:xanthine/uracil/vitamin C permease (AzgA family)
MFIPKKLTIEDNIQLSFICYRHLNLNAIFLKKYHPITKAIYYYILPTAYLKPLIQNILYE